MVSLQKGQLRISTTGTHMVSIRIKHLNLEKICSSDQDFKGSIVNLELTENS